jgi:hypothetical protein
MKSWAEREVEIACEKERKASGTPEGEWDYGCACYESALKAYNSLVEDDHSGMSWSLTKNILVRLMNRQPLTPIEDTDDIWHKHGRLKDQDYDTYQCRRMSSLFKRIYDDGRIVYGDNDRVTCVDINNGSTYGFGLVTRVIDEMFPITMPYMPNKGYKVYCDDFLSKPDNGDFDTVGLIYMVDPEGKTVALDKFYGDVDGKFVEITKEEYEKRKAGRVRG